MSLMLNLIHERLAPEVGIKCLYIWVLRSHPFESAKLGSTLNFTFTEKKHNNNNIIHLLR